jgi:hypothetical protein
MSATKSKNNVYISYSWEYDEKSKLIDPMIEKLKSIDFTTDKTTVGPRNKFDEFMTKLGKAEHVIVMLSDAYVKSYYCMAELLAIYKNGDLNGDVKLDDRVFFVNQDGFRLDDETTKPTIKQYWETVLEHRNQQATEVGDYCRYGSYQEVKNLNDELDNLISAFHRKYAENEHALREVSALGAVEYDAVVSWLRAVSPEKKLEHRTLVSSHQKYLQKIQEIISDELAPYPTLQELIAEKISIKNDCKSIAKALCERTDYSDLLNQTLKVPCKTALARALTHEKETVPRLKEAIWNIVSLLKASIFQRDADLKYETQDIKETNFSDVYGDNSLTLLAAIDREARCPSKIKLNEQGVFYSEDAITAGQLKNWDEKTGISPAQQFTIDIYHKVMGAHKVTHPLLDGKLKFSERMTLNTTINMSAEAYSANYHCLLNDDNDLQYMKNRDVLIEMQQLLPAFNFYLHKQKSLDTEYFPEDENRILIGFRSFIIDVLGDQ